MNVVRYEPRNLFKEMSDEMNRLFANRLGWMGEEADGLATAWLPAVDIKEDANEFIVHADLPGVDPKDVDVSFENGVLSISGKRETEKKDERHGYRRVERSYGTFQRRFTLPDAGDPEKITAKCDNGVLEVRIGKSEAHKPKRIPVRS